MSLRVGVLASGQGTNLQAILDFSQQKEAQFEVVVVIGNKRCLALERATKVKIPAQLVDPKKFPTRDSYDLELAKVLQSYKVDLVVLAGFMHILSPVLVKKFPQKIINIHPSLLPAFPGLHAAKQALEHGVKFSGCTIHFVDEGVDTGPIIAQAAVPILPHDTEETLSHRIQQEEHKLYPQVIQWISEKKIAIQGHHVLVHA